MPIYRFVCPECGVGCERVFRISERNTPVYCPGICCEMDRAAKGEPIAQMERVPTAASFSVKGYNAKNGYTGEK